MIIFHDEFYTPRFGLVWFYGKSTIIGYLMPNSIHKYIINLVWFEGISTIVVYLAPNPVYAYVLDIYDL